LPSPAASQTGDASMSRRRPGRIAENRWPIARPCGGDSVSDDPCRARGGASGQRSEQQPAEELARALSTMPHATRSAASSDAALDHLPTASGGRRSLPRFVSGDGCRTDVGTGDWRIGLRIDQRAGFFRRLAGGKWRLKRGRLPCHIGSLCGVRL